MAKRRRIGEALKRATDVTSQYLEILLRQEIEKERMEAQDKLMRDRFAYEMRERLKAADRQSEQSLLHGVVQNPKAASMLMRGGVTKLAGADLAGMLPTDEEVAGPLFDEIQKSTTPGTEPTGTEVLGKFRAGGGREDEYFQGPFPTVMGKEQVGIPTPDVRTPIADLMRARQSRINTNLDEAQRRAEWGDRYDPTSGRKITGRPDSPVPLEPTPKELGQNTATTLMSGELSPGVTQAKVRQAGAVSGAQAGAAEAARIKARFANRDLLVQVERELADARLSGKVAGRPSEVVIKLGEDMIKMSEQLNTKLSGPAAIGQGFRDRLEAMAQMDPVAKKLRDDRGGYTALFARLFGHTGVLTQQDTDNTMKVLPDMGLRKDISENRNKTFRAVLHAGRTIGDTLGAIDPNLSPQEQSMQYQERLMAAIAAAQGGELVFEVGTDGIMRVVVK